MKLFHVFVVTSAMFLTCTTARSQSFYLLDRSFSWPIPVGIFGFDFRQNNLPNEANVAPQPPNEFQDLSVEHRDYIIQLLDVWDSNSSQITLFTCDFCRWDFDRSIVDRRDPADDQLLAHRIVKGQVSLSAPDRFRYHEKEIWTFRDHRSNSPYACLTRDQPLWICDGETIFESDSESKQLFEDRIPDEIREKGEVVLPIPFLLGVKRQQILDRYWLRVATPQEAKNEIWLVAVPKQKSIARYFSKIELVLDIETFFLKNLNLYPSNWDPSTSDTHITYGFENPRSNDQVPEAGDFAERFKRPKLPRGWAWVGPINQERPRR